ncbi:MAG: hypothetical protein KKE17_02995 [Proteobacteria bacterium]|nr:hypothetical protein [Pseudomonadota bacterium]MBU1708949.1 hypothetical protein [Pseudomonadota bacterium]
MTNIRTQTTTGAHANTQAGIDTISKGAIAVMGGTSALIGLWAATCFVAAVVSNGPLAMTKAWFTAVAGM